MIAIKTVEETTWRFARGAIRAFLEDKKNLNWVLGMIKSSGVRDQRLKEIFDRLQPYGNPERYKEVISACRNREWL